MRQEHGGKNHHASDRAHGGGNLFQGHEFHGSGKTRAAEKPALNPDDFSGPVYFLKSQENGGSDYRRASYYQ